MPIGDTLNLGLTIADASLAANGLAWGVAGFHHVSMNRQTLYEFLVYYAGLLLLYLILRVPFYPSYLISLSGVAAVWTGYRGFILGPQRLLHFTLMVAGMIAFVLFSGVIITDEDFGMITTAIKDLITLRR